MRKTERQRARTCCLHVELEHSNVYIRIFFFFFWLSATHKTTYRSSLFAAAAIAGIAESIYRCLCVVNYWRLIIILSFCLSHFHLLLFQYIYANLTYKSHRARWFGLEYMYLTCANNLPTKIDYLQNRCDLPLDFVNLNRATHTRTHKITHECHACTMSIRFEEKNWWQRLNYVRRHTIVRLLHGN